MPDHSTPPYRSAEGYRCDVPLEQVAEALRHNGFETYVVPDASRAKELFFEIVAREQPASISWGGSMTLDEAGILRALEEQSQIPVIVTGGSSLSPEEKLENRRRALTCALFVTSSNAITAQGQLVNLDGIGNRVAALAFGPRSVVVIAGKNKIAPSLAGAMDRVKNYAAPMNIRRFADIQTPCKKTGRCHDCNSESRICNVWAITEKSRPSGRIKVILVDESLGY